MELHVNFSSFDVMDISCAFTWVVHVASFLFDYKVEKCVETGRIMKCFNHAISACPE